MPNDISGTPYGAYIIFRTNMGIMYQRTPFTNWSRASSNSSFATPSPFGCSTGDKGFLTTIEAVSTGWNHIEIALTELDIEIHVYLVQNVAHVRCLGVGEHHELDVGGRLVVVQLILGRPVRYEAIHHPIVSNSLLV